MTTNQTKKIGILRGMETTFPDGLIHHINETYGDDGIHAEFVQIDSVRMGEMLFHDARRTAVRNMDRAGVTRQTGKQITGYKTDAVYNRYRIVNEQDIREGMAQAQAYFLKHGQKADNNFSQENDSSTNP